MLEHLLGICPGVVYLGTQVVLCPIFWGTAKLNSRVILPACNPTNNGGVFLFLYILTRVCCHLSFQSYPFRLVWGWIPGLFRFSFPWWLSMLNISLGASLQFTILQLRIFCLALYPIFIEETWKAEKTRNVNKENTQNQEQNIIESSLVKHVLHIIKLYVCFLYKMLSLLMSRQYRIQQVWNLVYRSIYSSIFISLYINSIVPLQVLSVSSM